MIGIIVYMVGCFAAALVLTFLYVMMRPVNSRDELKSWRVLLVLYIMSLGAPYAYSEVLTKLVGANMKDAVQDAIDQSGVVGDLQYYKVVMYNGHSARVVAVTEGIEKWGGTDRPVTAISLNKEGQNWKVDSYRVISSFNSSNEGFTFPPYW